MKAKIVKEDLFDDVARYKVVDTVSGEIIDDDMPKRLAQKLAAKKKEWAVGLDSKNARPVRESLNEFGRDDYSEDHYPLGGEESSEGALNKNQQLLRNILDDIEELFKLMDSKEIPVMTKDQKKIEDCYNTIATYYSYEVNG